MNLTLKRVIVWLAVIIGIAYFTSLNGSFHFDDSHSVQGNPAVRSLANIPSFWIDARTSSFIPENRVYRPLVYTFYSFCWLIGGGATWPFHIMKMTMHLLVCLALFLIWKRLWSEPGWFPVKSLKIHLPFFSRAIPITHEWAAFFLAVVFAIHPAGSECVDYISATTSLQCAMFYVWAFYAYLVYRDSRDLKHLGASLFLYFLSVASKEEGITLPAMVLVTEVFLSKNSTDTEKNHTGFYLRLSLGAVTSAVFLALLSLDGKTDTLEPTAQKVTLGLSAVALVAAWAYFFAEGQISKLIIGVRAALPYIGMGAALGAWIVLMRPEEGHESRGFVSPIHYFITQWRAYLWYMRLWFWPWELNADTASMQFSTSFSDPLVIQSAIGNLLLFVFGWCQRKRFPAFLYGLLWFYITISPASSIVVLAEAINEHRMYLSYVGFVGGSFTVLIFCAEQFFASETRARRLGWAYVSILLGLFIGTQERNRVWLTDENLWADTVEKNPTSGRALNNLALVHMAKGEFDKALELLDRCEKHWTTYMMCPLNKSIAYQALGGFAERAGKAEESKAKYAEAEKSMVRAYQINPRSTHTIFHIGVFYQDIRKDYARAIEFFQKAIEHTRGRHPGAETRMGTCLVKQGRHAEALAAFDRALAVEKENEGALFEKAKLLLETKKIAESISAYESLLTVNPRHLGAWYNYGVAKLAKQDLQGARNAFEKTVQLDPKSEQGWYNLAFVAERMGDGNTALKAAQQLIVIDPSKSEFQERLRSLQKRFGEKNS